MRDEGIWNMAGKGGLKNSENRNDQSLVTSAATTIVRHSTGSNFWAGLFVLSFVALPWRAIEIIVSIYVWRRKMKFRHLAERFFRKSVQVPQPEPNIFKPF